MNSIQKLQVPKNEKLEVQLMDGTEDHNIMYVITSLSTIKGKDILKNFRLYSVDDNGKLDLIERRDADPYFDKLRGTIYES